MRRNPLFLIWLLFLSSPAWAYRPFIATDAGVADPQEMEIEFGYFNYERKDGEDIFSFPHLVFNYGIVDRLEGIAEFQVDYPSQDDTQITDAKLSLKAVLKDGFLQEKKGAQHRHGDELALAFNTSRGKKIWL